ncbi:hypothetical protein NP493_136g03011 [Ridgeia piscesae]|uniref:guanylate cyclase n=1 Tax=Ridgeia piscesae TaxID=27915 RepID=A0AAD9UG83_RIDPI|nr:hypothetical protein NP493_136g03011 [Ridgeia piscesae]
MLHASDLGLLNGQFVFITMGMVLSARIGANTWQGNDGRDDESFAAFEGTLDITSRFLPGEGVGKHFRAEIHKNAAKPPFNYFETEEEDEKDVYAFLLYDAIWLYALALNKSLAAGVRTNDTRAISQRLFDTHFTSFDDVVHVNRNGDVPRGFSLRNIQHGSFVHVADYNERMEMNGRPIIWPGGGREPVLGRPQCGWNNEHCSYDWQIVGLPLIGAFVAALAAAVAIRAYVLRRRRLEIIQECWNLKVEDEQEGNEGFSCTNLLKLGGEDPIVNVPPPPDLKRYHGRYNGETVIVIHVEKSSVTFNAEVIREILEARSAWHTNINMFVGVCVSSRRVSLVWGHGRNGCLSNVILNDAIRFDSVLTTAFATDIAEGMKYLQQISIKFHGRLTSYSVEIDAHWTCKITDYGLRKLRSKQKLNDNHRRQLWVAPEHLREQEDSWRGSCQGDVYSFAIVLHEILFRRGPFGTAGNEPDVCVARVRQGELPRFRPSTQRDVDGDIEVLLLMRQCWEEDPIVRPDFNVICRTLRRLNKGRHRNIVDEMIERMQKYADGLESIVVARTAQLKAEKEKTDALISQLLPRYVADELKMGKTVHPEWYESVTIFFSDIVGFTSFAAAYTPLQVIDFLNDLYTCFDTSIEQYDVYKVETIGDAYMVASGLPVRNGHRHSGEVADLALDLLVAVGRFKVRHEPDMEIKVRIGIHTGPVAAGVVGVKMPRYCLFGVTVNYASRMESSGTPMRIHVSSDCKAALEIQGGYTFEDAEDVTIKVNNNTI